MSAPVTHEARLLTAIHQKLAEESKRHSASDFLELRWQTLEAISARLGGFSLDWYLSLTSKHHSVIPRAAAIAEAVTEYIYPMPIHPSLALASLAQPVLDRAQRLQTGSFYTDFRLAEFMASAIPRQRKRGAILDPACGSGALLAATVLRLAGSDRGGISQLIRDVICGCDTSVHALRASRLVLASLTSDKAAIKSMISRLVLADGLLMSGTEWSGVAPDGFRAIIMNPPWERLKATRHEFLSAQGVSRHYGQAYARGFETEAYIRSRDSIKSYASALSDRFNELRGHEIDLYEAFLAQARNLLKDSGTLVALVPSGLIRSQGTEASRKALFDSARSIRISVFDNKPHFFAIDTRFKFLMVEASFSKAGNRTALKLNYPVAKETCVKSGVDLSLGREAVWRARPDYSLPEVRSQREWSLFRRIALSYPRFSDAREWAHNYCREVDMTKDRARFLHKATKNSLPLIEGRMVHQFSSSAKSYVGGTGRKAIWVSTQGEGSLKPQFWFERESLRKPVLDRTDRPRLGFCDITGQTNERTMLASIVPANAVCGNKVPTLVFAADGKNIQIAYCFAAIANSFAFDWVLRRIMTTTVNYFILDSMPMPLRTPHSPLALRLSQLSKLLSGSNARLSDWERAELRAEVDCRIFKAYGFSIEEIHTVLSDFPLLDRSEPPLRGELRSTITRDLILLRACEAYGEEMDKAAIAARVENARAVGAVAFRSSHMVTDSHLQKLASH